MPQTFKPRANIFSKVSIFGAVFFLVGSAFVVSLFLRSSYITLVGVPIDQPVTFPHDRHVAGLGIDCRFCHVSAASADFADLPPTHTCMTCHSQVLPDSPALAGLHDAWESGLPIAWVRVNDLGDYSYFSHQIHVVKGIGCSTCHGQVGEMTLIAKTETLYMEWCLECHRAPERFVRPREFVFDPDYTPPANQLELGRQLVAEYDIAPGHELDDCSICHR